MESSDAVWKLWGNSVPLMRLKLDLSLLDDILPDVVLSSDAWDGYNQERKELMQFVQERDVTNLVSIAGDLHAHFAGLIVDDYDSETPTPVAAEIVTAAISAQSMFESLESESRIENANELESMVRMLITYPDPENPNQVVRNADNSLINGVEAGIIAAQGGTAEDIEAARDPQANPHLSYADTDAHGYVRVTATSDSLRVSSVSIATITDDASTGAVATTREFRIPAVDRPQDVVLEAL